MRIALISNVSTGSIPQKLAIKTGEKIYTTEDYDNWIQELISPASGLFNFDPDVIFILLHGPSIVDATDNPQRHFDELAGYIKKGLENFEEALFVVSTLDIPERTIVPITENGNELELMYLWSASLQELKTGIIDLHDMITEKGREVFYSHKMWYLEGLPFSSTGEEYIAKEIALIIQALPSNENEIPEL